ncbi:M56 family metallopeptidase [Hymenobacter crusticola]|uniref:Peptidase M56 domain-containing protein n=1 Tax=Hymenobacter crusticola TaxID=1770526 RepID=A0A243W5N3_9BACT|nr:M56 family metallopeptidase [Hymenobacter crusticola]OUJ68944.1 hypothetical protein BXP70_27260 [Hymenobacter crusticola]
MSQYLLEASVSLLLTFGFYKVLLEQQPLHRFKRFYLLGSLLAAALIPLVSVEREPLRVWGDDQPVRGWPLAAAPTFPPPTGPPEPASVAVGFDVVAFGATYGPWLYGLLTAVFVGRFALNLRRLLRQTSANPRQPFRGATLVLLPTDTLPYAFLHYLFVSEAAYRRRAIEQELFTHELTHIRQRHSLDVLLVEVLLCVAWFHPVLYGVKRAMQLNHEFLADQAVNERHQNVPRYQQLLLDKVAGGLTGSLTSAFAFRTTQKRFLMMTKPTSRLRAWLLGGSAALLLGALGFLFGTDLEPAAGADPVNSNAKVRQQIASEAEQVVRQHGDRWGKPVEGQGHAQQEAALSAAAKRRGIVRRPNAAPAQPLETAAERTARLYDEQIAGRGLHEKKYADLSAEEKQGVLVVENKPLLRRMPTAAQWKAWQNPRQFRVWAEGKWLQGPALTKRYQRADIASFLISNITKELRQREGYVQQVHLTTTQEYEAYRKMPAAPYFVVVLRPTYSIK